jgi:hypothetical protein
MRSRFGDLLRGDVSGYYLCKVLSQAKRGLAVSGGAIPSRLFCGSNRGNKIEKLCGVVWPESSVELNLLAEITQKKYLRRKRLTNLHLLEAKTF